MKYSNERNAQIIASLLKQHGVRKIVTSPGGTNFPIVTMLQYDSYFQLFSCVDERSAAYMACGLAATSGEKVALTCTGATASRNYLPALTEAYYRKLPIIAITSYNGTRNIGQMLPQNIDRTRIQKDVALESVDIPPVENDEDAEYATRLVNQALIASERHGSGPVHINVSTTYNATCSEGEAPVAHCVSHYYLDATLNDKALPSLESYKRIAIFIGSHRPFDDETKQVISDFAERHDAVVFCDHTSNYHGFGEFHASFAIGNMPWDQGRREPFVPDLIIHIGEISGDYPTMGFLESAHAPSWRVSLDGELRDKFHTLEAVFECSEINFFQHYLNQNTTRDHTLLGAWATLNQQARAALPELPFSNRGIAQHLSEHIPANSIIHFSILNSLRSWNCFGLDSSIRAFCNTGGFGTDGALSTLLGSSLAEPETLHFAVVGDLAFFYDMNALGNRAVGSNLRIMLINNGQGGEFRLPESQSSTLGDVADSYVSAKGHFVPQRPLSGDTNHTSPAQAWCEALGFKYLRITGYNDVEAALPRFLSKNADAPIILECLTTIEQENQAMNQCKGLLSYESTADKAKKIVKRILPNSAINIAKTMLK